MTEQTTAPVAENPEATTPAIAEADLPDLAKALIMAARPVRDNAVKVSAKISAAGNIGETLTEAVEKSEDPEIVGWRTKIEKANALILDLTNKAQEKVRPTLDIPSDEDLEKLDTEYRELAQQINAYNNVFGNEVSRSDNVPDDAKVSIYTYIGDLPGRRRGARPGQGSGTARPRVKSVEFTHDLAGEKDWQKVGTDDSSTFTHLAAVVKRESKQEVTAADFHEPWLAAYPTAGGDWQKLPEVTTFSYSTTDSEGKTFQYMVRVTK